MVEQWLAKNCTELELKKAVDKINFNDIDVDIELILN